MNANGNLVAGRIDSFAYDQANRLKGATVGDAASSYVYNGDGSRTSKIVGTATTNYINDINRSLPVVLDDGTRKYVWGLDDLACSVDITGNVQVYYSDGLGSVRAVADGSGNVIETYQTDEFGVPVLTQGSVNQPFQYAGEQHDGEDGFYYLRARMYDPGTGRFLGRDPLAGRTLMPQTLDRYTYVANRPIDLVDPTCLTTWGLGIGGSFGAGLGLAGGATIVWDDSGNIGILFSGGGGGYAPATASTGSVAQYTTARNIYSLTSPTVYFGGSVGEGAGVGFDVLFGTNPDGSAYSGFQVQFAFTGKVPLPAEVHGGVQAGLMPIAVNVPGLLDQLPTLWREALSGLPITTLMQRSKK